MAVRKRHAANNHLQEAMALLIHNQAAFVEQIARNDQERLVLQRKSDEHELKFDAWRGEVDEWRRKSDERFERIEAELHDLPKKIIQTILDQLPRIRKEIGFKHPA